MKRLKGEEEEEEEERRVMWVERGRKGAATVVFSEWTSCVA